MRAVQEGGGEERRRVLVWVLEGRRGRRRSGERGRRRGEEERGGEGRRRGGGGERGGEGRERGGEGRERGGRGEEGRRGKSKDIISRTSRGRSIHNLPCNKGRTLSLLEKSSHKIHDFLI